MMKALPIAGIVMTLALTGSDRCGGQPKHPPAPVEPLPETTERVATPPPPSPPTPKLVEIDSPPASESTKKAVPAPGEPQTLGEAARSGKAARRGGSKGRVITNEDLKTHNKGKITESAGTGGEIPSSPPDPNEKSGYEGFKDDKGRDEEWWRTALAAAKRRIEEAKALVSELETKTKELETNFYSWDDAAYRDGVIKPEWDKAREDLVAARAEFGTAEKDLVNLEEDGRTTGALPGWFRE